VIISDIFFIGKGYALSIIINLVTFMVSSISTYGYKQLLINIKNISTFTYFIFSINDR